MTADDDVLALVDDPALRRDVPVAELTAAFLARLEETQPRLHAMITITAELALELAREVDRQRAGRRRATGARRPAAAVSD